MTHGIVYDRSGHGPPLLLVHGLGSHRQVWRPVLARLAAERDVVALDLPGFGASPPLPGDARSTVATLAGAIEAFVAGIGLDRPHVAGSSLGGGIALELARRGVVRSATALAPIGFGTRAEALYLGASLRTSRRLARLLRPFVPALRAVAFAQFFARPWRLSKADARSTVDAFVDAPAYDETLVDILRYRFREGREVRVPLTVAWGTRDRLLLPRQALRARRSLPAASHVWLEGSGHVPMIDDPEGTAAVVLRGSLEHPRLSTPVVEEDHYRTEAWRAP